MCEDLQLQDSGAKSVMGTPLLQRDVETAKAKHKVLVIGGIHGDERTSSSLAMHWIVQAAEISGNASWRFLPAVNPDGLLARVPKRTNANGVDLNRNFATLNWQNDALSYWMRKTKKDPRRFPGKFALSEPETRFVYEEIEKYKPTLIISIHAPYGVLDFDGPSVPPKKIGRLKLDQVGVYPGSLGNYGGKDLNIPVVTIELPNASKMPTAAEIRHMWLDLLRWIEQAT
jgi:hypothetical protein